MTTLKTRNLETLFPQTNANTYGGRTVSKKNNDFVTFTILQRCDSDEDVEETCQKYRQAHSAGVMLGNVAFLNVLRRNIWSVLGKRVMKSEPLPENVLLCTFVIY